MKTLLTFLLLFPVLGYAQKTFIENNKLNGILPLDESKNVVYQVVKDVPSTSKDELYKRGRKWITKTFNSPKDVIQLSDQATGEQSGTAILTTAFTHMGRRYGYPVSYKFGIETKEAKYRITLSDFMYEGTEGRRPIDNISILTGKKFYNTFYEALNADVLDLLARMEKAMTTADDF